MGKGVPLYEAAKRKILKRLETREWLPGAKLPPEGELSRELGVSVGTLRHAVGELCDEGILWRHLCPVLSGRRRGLLEPFSAFPDPGWDADDHGGPKGSVSGNHSRGRRVLCPSSSEER